MYIAKRDGKGGYRLFEPEMHEGVAAAARAAHRPAARAGARDQLELHYQPVVRLDDGASAASRRCCAGTIPSAAWSPPDQFIPLAEETGLIVPIGRWVLREGCRAGAALVDERCRPTGPLTLAINLSLKQLQHSDIVADVRDALEESGLAPAQLTLEITESVLMADTDLAVQRLAELKALGVRARAGRLRHRLLVAELPVERFPVDVLKMDRSFLREGASPQADGPGHAVVALGPTLSLEVVAEGIELPEQWTTLRDSAASWARASTSPGR